MEKMEPARKLSQDDFETIKMCLASSSFGDFTREILDRYFKNEDPEDEDQEGEWAQKEIDGDVVRKEIFEYPLGVIDYHRRRHTLVVMYTEAEGMVISRHGHEEAVRKNSNWKTRHNIKRQSELYIYYVPTNYNVPCPIEELNGFVPRVEAKYCPRGEEHSLVNNFGKPCYIISVKVKNRH